MTMEPITVFSVTRARDRAELGETITRWLEEHEAVGVRAEVRQTSDSGFHCLTIAVWYRPLVRAPS
jgi:hypothetical protein